MEIFRLEDKDDYEYEISSILSSADGWTSAILTGKRDSCRHFITSFSEKFIVAGTTTVRGLSFYDRERA